MQLLQSNFAIAKENDIVTSNFFDLYKEEENGNVISRKDDVPSHYLYVSEITEDGRFVVSSWGERFIYDNSDSGDNYCIILTYK